METDTNKFEQWALLEIMGHQRYAGLLTEQTIGGASFLRIDIPEVDGKQAFTKYFGASSVYSITPMEKDAVLILAGKLRQEPIKPWELPREFQKGITFNEANERDDGDIELDDEDIDLIELDEPDHA